MDVVKHPEKSITCKIETGRAELIRKNRKNITPIIQTVILCGKQNIPLRGHRDSGKIIVEQENDRLIQENQGNFREILRYRAQGDKHLKSFLEAEGTIKYTSATLQNEIIESCNKIILNKIVTNINAQRCFTILADETADIGGIEQVSLCARYLDVKNMIMKEEFLQFVPTTDTTGKGLADIIIQSLHSFGVDTKYLRGQGYDGCASMSGQFNGAQAIIRQSHPLVTYVHCAAHVLNLAISYSCSIQEIRNCLGTISKVRDFFIYPKRKDVLKSQIEESQECITKKTLKRLCATRWVERFHAVNDFLELFEYVIESLFIISKWSVTEISSQASNLRTSILKGDFIICLLIVNKVFSFGLPLSKQLQRINIDLGEAMDLAEDTIKELQTLRSNVDSEFHKIFENALTLSNKLDTNISIPHIIGRQTKRVNIETNSPESYFRVAFFIPYLDTFIDQLNLRRLESIKSSNTPRNAMEAIVLCNSQIYPNVFKLLQIFATLPVSTASNERSFSNLKRIKTYLRNTMSQGW
ncbi:52 kDa repressor of the inhibitor of the protein kinase-like [Daktulosphaira vitifoliae]|uniref:52 kDa repressor of the inhibitor of the protein kinase-like n=1 Tax=Daktulosphaira vitifoliae TaxID=58002 RepID=UPI0021AA3415|nr:52 kDa repressor of the inhibitor of the protein kinase-like [Daktulosphaira vitifoliae]